MKDYRCSAGFVTGPGTPSQLFTTSEGALTLGGFA